MQVTVKLSSREGAAHISGILAGFTLLAKRGELTLRVQDVRQGNPLAREALLDTIWAYEYRSDIRTVDVHIRRLREKLEENPAEPKYILTKWGVGYYFRK